MTDRPGIMYTDRTAIETDWLCGMKYFWNRVACGTGIVPAEEADYFITGRHMHDDFARVSGGEEWEKVVESIPQPDTNDQIILETWTRRIGWLAAFGLFHWPEVLKDYTVRKIEHELVLDRTPLWVAVKPDLLLDGRDSDRFVYHEYKGAKTLKGNFQTHWPYAIQMHMGLKAAEEEFGERLSNGRIIGVLKGETKYGRLQHPYVWAYRQGDKWSPNYKYGWDHAPVWEYPDGVASWVKLLGEDVARGVFSYSAPIFLDDRLLERAVQRRIVRQKEIETFKEAAKLDIAVREEHFEPRYIHCKPTFGPACPYLDACHNAEVGADPLGSGLFVPRQPHHELEIIGVDED